MLVHTNGLDQTELSGGESNDDLPLMTLYQFEGVALSIRQDEWGGDNQWEENEIFAIKIII